MNFFVNLCALSAFVATVYILKNEEGIVTQKDRFYQQAEWL